MVNRLLLLMLGAWCGVTGVQAQKQTEVSHYAYQRNFYADVNGDGVMEHLEKLQRTVYDYPAGAVPGKMWEDYDGCYYLPAKETETLKIIDGAYYQLFRMMKAGIFKDGSMQPYEPGMEQLEDFVRTAIVYEGRFTAMAIDYPEGREPDLKDGLDYWFRVASEEDVNNWLNYGYGGYDPNKGFMFHGGMVYEKAGRASSHYDTRVAWVDFNGSVKLYIDGTEHMEPYSGTFNADYNADGVTDVGLVDEDSHLYLAWSSPDGYTLKDTGLDGKYIFNCVLDLNRDGRPDLFGWENVTGSGTVTKHYPMTYIQMADGTFVRKQLSVVADPAEINDATFSTGGNGAFSTSYINMSGMSGGKGSDGAVSAKTMNTADLNLDGYPDLIDDSGHSFLSLPDGRYYAAAFAGTVAHSDLNGDGISDLVIFDTPNKQVLLYMSRGTDFEMTQLIENGNISAMYCRDLDGDGKTDILICIDTPKSENYAYLAFFRNNGDGTFRRTVRSLEGSHRFSKPFDLNHNGRPTLISHLQTETVSYRRIEWDENFALTQSDLFPRQWDSPISQNGTLMEFADYDGDGQPEIIANLHDEKGNTRTCLYTPAMERANTAPWCMDAPHVIADRSNGQVKVEWTAGKDDQTAACDLTYEVRISGKNGKNVMLNECGGKQLIANAGTWPLEKMNVSVRAIDTGGRCGEWSKATSFDNVTANALFTMDKHRMATADTLFVRTVDGSEATFKGMPDGKTETLPDGRIGITFGTAGNKTVTAATATGGFTIDRIGVNPLKEQGLFQTYDFDFSNAFDLNQSGTAEALNEKLYTFEKGRYTHYPAFSLSDVYIHPVAFADYDMDGRADILGTHTKNGKTTPWLVNDGDLEFTAPAVNFTDVEGNPFDWYYLDLAADFNNDGLLDYIYKDKLYVTKADGGVEYVPFPEIEGWTPNEVISATDFDRDGRMDLLMRYYNRNNSHAERMSTYILHNEGSLSFEPVVVFDRKDEYIDAVKDVDNDGYPDLITSEYLGNDRYTYSALSGGKELKDWKTLTLPGYPLTTDLDNDGLTDYILGKSHVVQTGDSILLSGMGGTKMRMDESEDWYGLNVDAEAPDYNADGRPDPGVLLMSRFANTAPTAPTEVFANTGGRYVTVNWNGATDAETTTDRLRYNVSIRKKGARGAGSYIISPLNATDSKAVTAPALYNHYRYGTQMEIPVERFEAGATYEICVQAIDPWHAHSPFSKVFEFTPKATAMISMAQRGGVGMPMPIQIYDNSGTEPTIDADGGVVSGRIITWNTLGLKKVKVTAGAASDEHAILIVDRPMLRITLPENILTGEPLTIALPQALTLNEEVKTRLWADDGMDVEYDARHNTAIVTPRRDGDHTLHISYADNVFTSPVFEYAETRSTGTGFRPELTMVGVDGATGKNRVNWNAAMTLPQAKMFTGNVAVYRETNMAGHFEKIAECPLSQGFYVDNDSRPDVQSDRYMISLPTTYGTESAASAVHGSIHLMVNRGMGHDINLHWTPYEGAAISQYTIMSGSSPENLQPLTTVSGHARSYTHKRSDDRTTFYSITYTLQQPAYAAAGYGPRAGRTSEEGVSNVISSDDAYHVTMVESILIGTREQTTVIGPANPQLHLTATVMPVLATIGNVEWTVTRGNELASIAPDGTLSVLDNTTGGTVTVCARAIDGSDVTATLDFTVEAYASGIDMTDADENMPTVRPGYRSVLIDPHGKSADITIYTANGSILHRSMTSRAVNIPLQPGFYVVKAGSAVKKLVMK